MQDSVVPAGGNRKNFLLMTFALPAVLGCFMIISGLLADVLGPREITYQTVHPVDLEQTDFALLKARIESLDAGDARVQRVSLDIHKRAEKGCEGNLAVLDIMFHANVRDVGVQELRGALLKEAYATGLGPPCGGFFRIKMESAGSVDGRAWLMPLLLAPLALVILLFNWLSRRGWRPFWLNWADWQPSVREATALRLGVGYAMAALFVVIGLGALADLAGWLPEKPHMLPTLEHWPWLIFASFVAPIFEEFIYRAWLLERLTRMMRDWMALLISTGAFAAVHFPSSVFEWLNFFLAGLVFGLLWLRTRSLLAVSVAHALYNGTLMTLQIILAGYVLTE